MEVHEYKKIVDDAQRFLRPLIDEKGLPVRVFGSLAVMLACPNYAAFSEGRSVSVDFDLVTDWPHWLPVDRELQSLGLRRARDYFQAKTLRGRLEYVFEDRYAVEVFCNPLNFHHTINLNGRLRIEQYTIPLADLLMSKLQFKTLSRDQLVDLVALLGEHRVDKKRVGGIDLIRIQDVTQRDWGLWSTVTQNLSIVEEFADGTLKGDRRQAVKSNVQQLMVALNTSRKTIVWRMRSLLPFIPPGQVVDEPEDSEESIFTSGVTTSERSEDRTDKLA